MIRPVSLLVAALAMSLVAGTARAQGSEADLLTRIDRLEAALRDVTGQVEQLQFRNRELEQQLQRLQAGMPQAGMPQAGMAPRSTAQAPYQSAPYQGPPPSVGALPAANPSAIASAPPLPVESAAPLAATLGHRGDAFDPSATPNAPGAPRPLGTSTVATEPPPPVNVAVRQPGAPLDLSTPGAAPPGSQQATLPPSNSPKDAYDLAYGYVLHKDYPLAADAFRAFLRQYPSDRQAPEAQFWLGESLFQQQQYRDAAEAFLAVSTKYDTTSRAPEALLRLGQALAALGEKEAACASLGEVLRKYPHAPANIKSSVEREQKRGHC